MDESTKKKALFFVLEGLDGSGKTTQVQKLSEKLRDEGYKVWVTCEPTKSPIGTVLRDILTGKMKADPRVVSALFATERLNHILEEDGILAHLNQGEVVISDRYYFSSYAYHSVEQDLEKIIGENAQNASILSPTATLFLDIHPEKAMERIHERQEEKELYENLERLTAIDQNYKKAFERLKGEETVVFVDAALPQEEVLHQLFLEVQRFL